MLTAGVRNDEVAPSARAGGRGCEINQSRYVMGQAVTEWRCAPASSDGIAMKFIPAGCRG
jgi:hypothetical protein